MRARPLSYWQCRRILAWLVRFKNLLIHKENIGIYLRQAPPLVELLPGVSEMDARVVVIDQELNRLVPLVHSALERLTIPVVVTVSDYEHDLASEPLQMKEVRKKYDLIGDYFQLPRDGGKRQDYFHLVLHTLERGIGGAEELKRRARLRMFNPVWWVAWVVGLPITILEMAGVPMDEATSKGITVVAWLLRLAMFVAVSFAAAKLGFSVHWDKLLAFLK
jgi:hypothetical protein